MNHKLVGRFLSLIVLIEAIFMLTAWLISLAHGEMAGAAAFAKTIVVTVLTAALLLLLCRKAQIKFYAREGLVSVGLGWIIMSFVGCMPFLLSGEIPHFVDAYFETVSGFTTTGASILTDV